MASGFAYIKFHASAGPGGTDGKSGPAHPTRCLQRGALGLSLGPQLLTSPSFISSVKFG